MSKIALAVIVLCAAGRCAAQSTPAPTQSEPPSAKHFRLTFVLSYPIGEQPPQTFVLDVPVSAERPGMAGMSTAAGLAGQVEGSVQKDLQCSDVRESATGLAANVSFAMDSVSSTSKSATKEPLHSKLTFQRQVDVALGKPTTITDELHVIPLGKQPVPATLPPAPQIILTVNEL